MLTTESNETNRIHFVPRTWDHNRVYCFPPRCIRHPEDRGFQDGRVLVEDFFDLSTVDILAAGDNHILGAIDEENVALSIHITEVPTVIPPAAQGIGGLLGFVPVTLHDVGAAHDDLANL